MVLKAAAAYVFHAGDFLHYLLRGKDIEQLTNDHRVRVSREREYLSRAVGIAPDLEIDYKTFAIERGDTFVFTTHGVHDCLRDGALAEIVLASSSDLDAAARRVVETALANGSPDNLTCQIVRVDHPGRPDEEAVLKKLSALPFPPELSPGMVFEGYTILRDLHLSKRTQVYLARDLASGELVVLEDTLGQLRGRPGLS